MRRKVLLALLCLLALTVLAAACGPASLDVVIGETTAAPSPSPTEFAGIPLYGTGTDGTLVVSAGPPVVVNVCHQLVGLLNGTSLDLSSTTGFQGGQALLLLQERDRSSAEPPGRAGLFELVRLASVNGASAFTRFPVANAYESAGGASAQACSVPEYLSVIVQAGGTLRAAPRDLVAGGVLAFLVSSSLSLDIAAVITADDLGFSGGSCDSNNEATTSDAPDDLQGGGKGEGLLGAGEGRGRLANGGGGGNPFQAGGGGGGAARDGGRGGGAIDDPLRAFGEGGGGIAGLSSGARLFFGGGGGGGHSASGEEPPCDGGAGGGVIFVQAREAHGDGGQIQANGENIEETGLTTSGGGGGGGGGGSIWFIVGTGGNLQSVQIGARGGKGGDTGLNVPAGAGPGGGGGGGFARVGGLTGYVLTLGGGDSGLVENLGDTRGATSGSSGTIF